MIQPIQLLNLLGMGGGGAAPPELHGHVELTFTINTVALTYVIRNVATTLEQV